MAGPVRISIAADGSAARREFVLTASAADRMGSRIGRSFGAAGRLAKIGAIGLTAALGAIGKSAVETGAQFSQRMSLLGAATGIGTKGLEKFRDQAKDLGAVTSFSANEAADAMVELGKSGFKAAQITKAVPEVMNLAATEGLALADAAGTVTSALAQFGLKASDSAQVVNALAGASNASRSSVATLSESLKLVGSASSGIGLSVQETAGALAALSQSGLDGSVAGTSLAGVFNRLIPSTKAARTAMGELNLDFTNAKGEFDSVAVIAEKLQGAFKGLDQESRKVKIGDIFGRDASTIAAVNALVDAGGEGLRKYTKAAKDQNAAQKVAEARMAGTAGALDRLSGAAETSKLVIGEALAPVVVKVADYLSKNLVPATEQAVDWTEKFISKIQDIRADPEGELGDFGATLSGIDWPKAIDGAQSIASSLAEIGGAVGASGLDVLADTLSVTGEVLEFAADNSDKLAAALPFLAAGYVAVKVAQVAANIAMAAAIPLRLAELAASRQQTIAVRALTIAVQQMSAAQAAAAATGGAAMIRTQAGTYSAVRQTTTATTAATQSISKLGVAARGAAGIGGMVALSAASQQTSDSMKILGATASGALLGFSVGGPVGGAIGAGVGAIGGLLLATQDSTKAMEDAIPVVGNYASSLDALTGAVTAQTRAEIFKQATTSGALEQARELGISSRDVVNSVLGQEGALRRVTTALGQVRDFTAYYTDANGNSQVQTFRTAAGVEELRRRLVLQGIAYDSVKVSSENAAKVGLSGFIGRESDARIRNERAMRSQIQATQDLSALYGKVPKRVVTKLEQTGIEPTLDGIARVVRENKLIDKKQIRAVISASGIDATVKQVRRVVAEVEKTSKAKGDLRNYVRGIEDGISGGKRAASRGATELVDLLAGGTRKAKADLGPFRSSLTSGLTSAKSTASSGGVSVGANLQQGVINGFAGTQARLSAQAAAAVRGAISAAKAVGRIFSPSKETEEIGKNLGLGLEVGMKKRIPGAKRSGADLVRAALTGIIGGSDGVTASLEKVTRLIEKQIKLKNDKAETKRERAIIKGLQDEFAQLKKNGKEQDRNTAKLEAARDRYKQLVQESKAYAASIKDQFVGYGSIVGLGQLEDGSVSTANLLDQAKDRLMRAERFADLIRSLSGTLNRTSLQQLLDAGVDGGLATAEAITAGGASAVTQINALTAQIAAAGGGLGATMADKFKQAGVDAAAGLVIGLEREQKRLDQAAERIGATIVKAIKKSLGIKSPSRVFRSVGEDTMAGLALGLDETYARTLGARVGLGVARGYTRPTLGATIPAAAGAASAPGQTIRVQIELSAQQVNELQQSRRLSASVDVGRSSGVRRLAVGGPR